MVRRVVPLVDLLGQQVRQARSVRMLHAQPHRDGRVREVVEHDRQPDAPVVPHPQDVIGQPRQNRPVAPANLGTLLARPDDPLGPVQERIRIAPLVGDVHTLIAVDRVADEAPERPRGGGETAVAAVRPLHRRPRCVALGQRQIVTAIANLIAMRMIGVPGSVNISEFAARFAVDRCPASERAGA